jgi:hypothetical protein
VRITRFRRGIRCFLPTRCHPPASIPPFPSRSLLLMSQLVDTCVSPAVAFPPQKFCKTNPICPGVGYFAYLRASAAICGQWVLRCGRFAKRTHFRRCVRGLKHLAHALDPAPGRQRGSECAIHVYAEPTCPCRVTEGSGGGTTTPLPASHHKSKIREGEPPYAV